MKKLIIASILLLSLCSLTGCAGLAQLSGNVVGSVVRNF